MSVVNKTQAMLDYLLTCPLVQNNPAYFNFGIEKNNSKQLITETSDTVSGNPYVDGSVLKKFYFTILDFRSVTDNAIVKVSGYSNENIADFIDCQGIIDWIKTQNDLRNFPNFGTDCIIDSIEPLTDTPAFVGVDTSVTPALARYDTSISVTYLDTSKQLWN